MRSKFICQTYRDSMKNGTSPKFYRRHLGYPTWRGQLGVISWMFGWSNIHWKNLTESKSLHDTKPQQKWGLGEGDPKPTDKLESTSKDSDDGLLA